MIIQKAENIVCYDVDGTLVTPDDVRGELYITNPYNNITNVYREHRRHVELLKSHKGRGKYVKVWSAAGNQWALTVVKALNLEAYVDAIETKPELLVDDLSVTDIFPSRVFLKE